MEEMPGGGKKLVGTADNAFNRERAAVKAHAAATSGEFLYPSFARIAADTELGRIREGDRGLW